MLKVFHLERVKDISGISGCGRVAEGCLFVDTGEVVIHWLGDHGSINIYHSLEDLVIIHGHSGSTEIVFEDPEIDNKK
ncbi:hypothetical protein MEO41_25990 [Dolichospermum sp. ST_sed4]|nr:hypothetical protein [Dolichospermum sp. ST_sed4]